jgi:cyclopropane-fatty-acyl-phospholipid synthase
MTSTLDPDLHPAFEALDSDASEAPASPVPAAPPYGIRGRLARELVRRIVRRVAVRVELPDGSAFGGGDATGPALAIADADRFFARVGASPMIGLGEGYMAGDWTTVPGTDLADALAPFAERLTDLVPPLLYRLRHVVLPRLGGREENTPDGARENIHRHYDLSNDMFTSFLDPTLSYSCALFDRLEPRPTQADLEAAQLAKIDAVLDAAAVGPGTSLLEIGTGWGSLAIRAAERGATVTTLTLSEEQADLARKRVAQAGVADRVEVLLRDYREEHGRYDAVVSVEMVEAVGEKYWPAYFTQLDRVLLPGGRAAVQAILLEHDRMLATKNTYGWIQKYIFPGGLLPSVEAIEQVLDEHTTLRLTGVRRIGPHYAHTLRLWREQFCRNWPGIAALGFDDTFRRMWEFYLAYCEAGFRTGYLDDAILTLQR